MHPTSSVLLDLGAIINYGLGRTLLDAVVSSKFDLASVTRRSTLATLIGSYFVIGGTALLPGKGLSSGWYLSRKLEARK